MTMTKSSYNMYSHILTSIVGSHPNIQDAYKYFENDDIIIAIIADGLGSRNKSAYGARLICKLMVEELKYKKVPLNPNDVVGSKKWHEFLEMSNLNCDDYCTTCSFALIDKKSKQIAIGQIGDSPIFLKLDDKPVIEMRKEKEFTNITDSLGGRYLESFELRNYQFSYSIRVMVTSDGIGEELDSSCLDSMFSYLSSKYQQFTPKSRSRRFTKEMKATIGKINHDDKSSIFIWSV